MIKFANTKFIFGIRGPKLATGGMQDKIFKHKIGGFVDINCIPGMT